MPAPDLLIAGGRSADRIDLRDVRAALLAAEGDPDTFAAEVQILRPGSFDFGVFQSNVVKVDDELMASFITAFSAGARGKNADDSPAALPVDIDHETREAVGWIDGLAVADGNLMASVTWNPVGVRMLKDDTFRHMSVMFSEDYKDPEGKKWGPTLWGAAVTNYPRIKDMEAVKLAAKLVGDPPANEPTKGDDMDPKLIATALGLPETATDDEILAAATERAPETTNDEHTAALAEITGLKASVTALETRATTAETRAAKVEAEACIAGHKEAGRLTDGHLVDAEGNPNALASLAETDLVAFDTAVSQFPVVVEFGTRGTAAGSNAGTPQAKFEAAIDDAVKAGAADYNAAVAVVQATKPELVAAVYTAPARV
ncbi:MAG: hypothetical protein GY937_22815 [bacterium]|nr:hypothetical protein [bacterium]